MFIIFKRHYNEKMGVYRLGSYVKITIKGIVIIFDKF